MIKMFNTKSSTEHTRHPFSLNKGFSSREHESAYSAKKINK